MTGTYVRSWKTIGSMRAGAARGWGNAEKINGTKRHIAVDTSGLLLAVVSRPPRSRAATVPGRCYGISAAPAVASA
jgi:hypothetical protein